MGLPAVLCEVRTDGVEEDQLGFDEFEQELGIGLAFLGDEVVFLQSLDLEEPVLQGLLVLYLLVVLRCQVNCVVYLVVQDLVPQIEWLNCGEINTFFRHKFFEFIMNPLVESE